MKSPRIGFWRAVVTYDSARGRLRRLFVSEAGARRLYRALARAGASFQAIAVFDRPIRRGPRRRLGNLWFICDRPGWWFSECGRFSVFCMLKGTGSEQWQLFRQGRDNRGRWNDTLVFLESCLGMGDFRTSKALLEAV